MRDPGGKRRNAKRESVRWRAFIALMTSKFSNLLKGLRAPWYVPGAC